MTKIYKLRYLPIFYDDMEEKVLYIRHKLKNPKAAMELVELTEKAILERLPNCESYEQYHSKNERKYPYYRIYIKNFVVYYVVITEGNNKVMEVRRFLYNRQDSEKIV